MTFEIDWDAVVQARSADATRGLRHRYDVDPNPPPPGQPGILRLTADRETEVHEAVAVYTADGSVPEFVDGSPWRGQLARFAPASDTDTDRIWTAEIPGYPEGTRVRYRIAVRTDAGWRAVTDAGPGFEAPYEGASFVRPPRELYSYVVREPQVPDWLTDAVIYHALVDRFARPGSFPPDDEVPRLGFVGGTLEALTAHLDHIAELGADTLLISPIFPADMHVCYDHRDLLGVEPRLGTLADARGLCHRAHELGIRVLLDLVLSYFGETHPWVQAARRDPRGPYAQRFQTEGDQLYGWFGSQRLAAVDQTSEAMREHLLEVADFWLEAGFDGFRIDSAHVGSLDFWTEFGDLLRRHTPEAVAIGEVTRTPAECFRFRGRLHGFFDFFSCYAIREFCGQGAIGAAGFDERIAALDDLPEGLAAPLMIDNHDMDRFSSLSDSRERLRLGLLLLFTLPGPPILYYGTEVGVPQGRRDEIDPGARMPMRWGDDQDTELLAYVRELIALRRGRPELRRGTRRTVLVADPHVYAFARELDDRRTVVVVNAGPEGAEVEIDGERVRVEALSGLVLPEAP